MRRVCILAVVVAVVFSMAHARAAMIEFDALLDGAQETPPVVSTGTGTASLTLDDTTGDWTLVGDFTDLIGTTIGAHIHGPAPVGTPAGIVVPLTVTLSATSGTLSGAGTFTAPQMADLTDGLYYINVHTDVFSGGEIRGQLSVVPEPATFVLLAVGAVALLGVAWRKRSTA